MAVRRGLLFGLLAIWVLTGASSCRTTARSGNLTVQSSGYVAAAGAALFLVGAGIYCLANNAACFPDEEAADARRAAQAAAGVQAQASFAAGLRRTRAGEPTGLEWICLAAHRGYANAQYFYGVHLLRRDAVTGAEAAAWLRRAAAQGHREATILSRRLPRIEGAGSIPPPATAAPPTYMACANGRSRDSETSLTDPEAGA